MIIEQAQNKKLSMDLVNWNRMITFAPDEEPLYGWWLSIGCSSTSEAAKPSALNAFHSRMWNWVRLPNRNPVFFQFPRLPLYKEKLRIPTKLRKNERNAKGKFTFLFIFECRVSSAKPKLRKVEHKTKKLVSFSSRAWVWGCYWICGG